MCENKGSKIEDIETKFKELDDDLKKYVDDYESINKQVEEFKSNVESQKREIKNFVEELQEIKSEDALEEFETKVENIEKELYANNKDEFYKLEKDMKEKVDKLEDEVIINSIHDLMDAKNHNRKKEDKIAIQTIVEASFDDMIKEVLEEMEGMDEYIETGEKINLGINKYDLSPEGIMIVRTYVDKQEPDKILKDAKKEEKEKKSVIEKNKEYNIDILNLLLGGILTQDIIDLINSDKEEDTNKLLKDIKKYLDRVVEYVKVLKDDEYGKKVVKVFEEIKERGSSFGLTPEVVLNIDKLVKDLDIKGKKVLQIHEISTVYSIKINPRKCKKLF